MREKKHKDINIDGVEEVFMQFQGKGNYFPDINILSWESEEFQIAQVNRSLYEKNHIGSAFNSISSTISDVDDSVIKIEINGQEHGTTFYKFETLDALKLK